MKTYKAFVLVGASVLTACASKNSAPVVYGTQPSSSARIYHSRSEIVEEQRLARENQQRVYRASTYQSEPVRETYLPTLAAVEVTPTETEVTRQRYDYDSKPVYIARQQPISLGGSLDRAPTPGTVIVEQGDTVYGIARKTGVKPNAIITLNRLRKPYALNIGQRLRVPSSTVSRSRTASNDLVQKVSNLPVQTNASYIVRPGDTLYSISRRTGAPVASLAESNRLRAPYSLSVGQALIVPDISLDRAIYNDPIRSQEIEATVTPTPLSRSIAYETKAVRQESPFAWPIKGAIVDRFGSTGNGRRNDGVNIAAPVGAPIRASADGEVVYRGSELDGYGNLLLIKHDGGFVTAYAHNDVMLVRKGQNVRKGQVIAKVGQSGSADQPQLHFEIRQNLKAVDPLALLDQ